MLVKALVNLREAAPLLLILIAALVVIPGILRRLTGSALRRAPWCGRSWGAGPSSPGSAPS